MTQTFERGGKLDRASARGKGRSFEPCYCLAVTTCLPTQSLANFVRVFKITDVLMGSPLRRRENLALLNKKYD